MEIAYKMLDMLADEKDAEKEQMKQEFKVLADKADERVQLLEKKNAQLQEDLERLDAENMLRMKDMMKDEMEIAHKMLHILADEKDAEFMLIIKEIRTKAHDDKTWMMELQNKVNDLEKYEKYVKDLEKYACQSTLLRARW